MNIKALALSSALALGSIFGTVGAAEARPSQCWNWPNGSYSQPSTPALRCDVARKVDEQGTWWSIDHNDIQIRLYDDGTAQVWSHGKAVNNGNNWFLWRYDSQGDIRLSGNNGDAFAFRR